VVGERTASWRPASVTAPDPGNLCGWIDLNDVVAALESGDTYLNVHTKDEVEPLHRTLDFPGGEIRGQSL
jgi:hypothetical protein